MFGFSLAELIIVCLVALFFIKPKDLPEIAHFLGKIFYQAKKLIKAVKKQFKDMEQELGIDQLKQEMHRGMAEEKTKSEENHETIIIDIYGNEHKIQNLQAIRPDLTKDQITEEINQFNPPLKRKD